MHAVVLDGEVAILGEDLERLPAGHLGHARHPRGHRPRRIDHPGIVRLLEDCLLIAKQQRLDHERERNEEIRRALQLEIERERRKARERADQQRKTLDLEAESEDEDEESEVE